MLRHTTVCRQERGGDNNQLKRLNTPLEVHQRHRRRQPVSGVVIVIIIILIIVIIIILIIIFVIIITRPTLGVSTANNVCLGRAVGPAIHGPGTHGQPHRAASVTMDQAQKGELTVHRGRACFRYAPLIKCPNG